MKTIFSVLMIALASVSGFAATDTPTNTPTNTPTWTPTPYVVPPSKASIGQVFISPAMFKGSDGASHVSMTTSNVYLTGTASAWPSCAPCAVMTNSLGISFTAMILVPGDIIDKPGNGKLYAIVSQSSANDAGLRATFATSDVPNSLSWTSSVAVSRYGIEGTVVGARAAVKPVYIELASRTSTATSSLQFKPNQLLGLTVQRSAGATGNLIIRGLVFEYNRKSTYGY